MSLIINKKILFIIATVLFATFIGYSYLVAKERFTQLDFDLTVKFQDNIPAKFALPFSLFSILGSAEVSMTIWLILLLVMLIKKFWLTAAGLFLLPLALAIEIFGKLFLHHPAPPYLFYRGVLDVNFPLHFTHTDYSYPSGHEIRTVFLVMFFAIYFYLRKNSSSRIIVFPALFVIFVVMSISRIYLGEHWTSDVIGGFLLGTSFGILAGITVPTRIT